MNDFKRDVTGIGALEDDLRRELYEFVTACSRPVSREQAAHALGVPPHQAKFHLDRLEEAGLLKAEYVRLTGRSGPGAGRPAKVYRRSDAEISVSLPGREYALAGELMATAIDDSSRSDLPVVEALARAARARGAELGEAAPPDSAALESAKELLSGLGYEPRVEGDAVLMANCPFHSLAAGHPALVCGMNQALLEGVCDRLDGLEARLEPAEDRCCVVLHRTRASSA
ncbi:MAG TPA: helix-turn-helix domain-containing protein [Propionibacteriaceae bacterium]|nr:helix-turn-helix domain-containing protein [Propionibacteriaceae bacterium]